MTGDWFYDQKLNRFSAAPGHGLVSHSLKRRSQCVSNKEEVAVAANQECKLFSKSPCDYSRCQISSSLCVWVSVFMGTDVFVSAATAQEAVAELPLISSDVNPVQPPAPLPRAKPRSLMSNKTLVSPFFCHILPAHFPHHLDLDETHTLSAGIQVRIRNQSPQGSRLNPRTELPWGQPAATPSLQRILASMATEPRPSLAEGPRMNWGKPAWSSWPAFWVLL